MATIHSIANQPDGPTVVFIHGLEGDAVSTWQSAAVDWPRHLAQANPGWSVLSIGYDATMAGWRADMSVVDRATQLLEALFLHLGSRSGGVALVTHSLGGLVAKQMVRHAHDHPGDHAWLLKRLAGIVFVATPHAGAALASYLQALGSILGAGKVIADLERGDGQMANLNQWYRNHHAELGLRSLVCYETQRTKLGWLRTVQVVEPSSADPGIPGVKLVPLDADHFTAAKPADEQAQQLQSTQQFLAEALRLSPQLARLRQQAGAVCYRVEAGVTRFLLVLSDRGYRLHPKGNIKTKRAETPREAAMREAGEEAGVSGTMQTQLPTVMHRKVLKGLKQGSDADAHEDIALTLFLLQVSSDGHECEEGRDPQWFNEADARRLLTLDRPAFYAAENLRAMDAACAAIAALRGAALSTTPATPAGAA